MYILLVVPAFNEELFLESTVKRIVDYTNTHVSSMDILDILIVDNGSTDSTASIGVSLSNIYSNVEFQHISISGKGHALKVGWVRGSYDYYCYIDADLAHDLRSITVMISHLKHGCDVVVGSRTLKTSIVKRRWLRKFLTLSYNFTLRILFRVHFTDAQAGCKGISREVRDKLLPLLEEGGYFFDTQLLVLAEKSEFYIYDFAVVYHDPRKWRYGLIQVILHLLYKSLKLRIKLWNFQ